MKTRLVRRDRRTIIDGDFGLDANPSSPPLDAWPLGASVSRVVQNYTAPPARTLNVFDPDANSFRDWTPQPSVSRRSPAYAAPVACTLGVFDPALNTFADWTPGVISERKVLNYSSVRSQAVTPSITADTYAAVATERQVPAYCGSYSMFVAGADEAIVGTDWAQSTQSRITRWYSSVLSSTQAPGFSVITAGGTEFAPPATSRVTPFYRGSYSAISGAADSAILLDAWASVTQGRSVNFYESPATRAGSVFDQPAAPSTDTFGLITQGPQRANYKPPASQTLGVFFTPDTFVVVAVNGHQLVYRATLSQTLTPNPVIPDTYTSATTSRYQRYYAGPLSQTPTAYFAPPDTYGAHTRSRTQGNYTIQPSLVSLLPPGPDVMAFISQARAVPWYTTKRSSIVFVFDGPSGVPPDSPAIGGAGDFVVFRDPFRQNPFRDPFREGPYRIKVPTGER